MFETTKQLESHPAGTTEVRLFDSLAESAATLRGRAEEHEGVRCKAKMDDPLLWQGFVGRRIDSLDDLENKLNGQWQDGLNTVECMIGEIGKADLPRPKSRRRRKRWSEDTGDDVDLDRLRAGQPYWRRTARRQTAGRPTVTIACENSTPASIDSEEILWRGAAAIVLTKLLEDAGYRVELWTFSNFADTYCDKTNVFTAVKLKASNAGLDLSTLVNAVSGWSHRTLFHGLIAASHEKRRLRPTRLGIPTKLSDERFDLITTDSKRHLIDGVWSYSEAVECVRNKLNDLN